MQYQRRFWLAGAISLTLFLTFGLILFGIDFYYDGKNRHWWPETTFEPRVGNITVCEQKSSYHFIREPLNTVSSLLFISTYVYPLFYGIQDKFRTVKSILSHYPDVSIILGCVALLHNFGTSSNHISAINLGLILDNSFAWMLFVFYMVATLKIFTKLSRGILYSVYTIFSIGLVLLAIFNQLILLQNIISAILIITTISLNFYFYFKDNQIKKKKFWWWFTVVCTVIALTLALFDTLVCYKQFLSLHPFFHLFGALGLWSMYLYLWTLKKIE